MYTSAGEKANPADVGVRVKHKGHFFLPSTGNDYEDEIEEFPQDSDVECDERDIPLTAKTSKWFQQKLLFPRTTQVVIEDHFGRWVRRLREPWDLHGLSTKRNGQLTCWPHECEVIKERIRHIVGVSLGPEPLYKATGLERTPIYTGPEEGEVVYTANKAYLEPYFTYSRVSGSPQPLKQAAVNLDKQKNTLIFEARFESGNLQKVFKVGNREYNLILRTDLYTAKHTQWYYFRVQNTRVAVPYRFTIINLMKPTSLYNMGMKPLMYSTKEANLCQVGWRRVGSQIKYYKNNYGDEKRQYYSLTWTFQFPHDADTCYFAHCYPYTYSDLQDYLMDVANDPVRSSYCKIRVLCRSLAGNMVYVLTVTNPSETPEAAAGKKAVILTARVHPGETNSSWMMKGFLDCLLGNSVDAKLLRDVFMFKIVPMLNPDGVIVGNYRCSLSGQDLNRKYRSFLKEHYPPVWYTQKLIKRLVAERTVFLYCDLHGHSRKQNIFVYGCQRRHSVSSCVKQRVFPLMLSKNCFNKFSLQSCKFHVRREKEGTGRVVAWRMGVTNSYTLEATFCGSTLGNRKNIHFNVNDLELVGFQFCDTLLDYCDPDPSKYIQCTKQLQNQIKEDIASKMEIPCAGYDSDTSLSNILSCIESSTTGSNSSESDDLSLHYITEDVPKRKKQLKTKKERQNSYLIRHVLDTAKHYQFVQQPQAPKKPEQTHGENHLGRPFQGPYQNGGDLDSGVNGVQECSRNGGKRKRTEDVQSVNRQTHQKVQSTMTLCQVQAAMIGAPPQPHNLFVELENKNEREQPTASCYHGPQVVPRRNTTIHERKAGLGTSEDSMYEGCVSGGLSMRLHHPTNTVTKKFYQNSASIFSTHIYKRHFNNSKYEFEWVPRSQPAIQEKAHSKPRSDMFPMCFLPAKNTKLPVIDHVQNRDWTTARRETFYKILAVPPSILVAGSFSSETTPSTTNSQSVQDSARVEQEHSQDADPNHQEEVCLVESSSPISSVSSPGLASSRLGNRSRSYRPYSGKQVFSEEQADILDSANRRMRNTWEGVKNQPGSDQRTAFTHMWQSTDSHNSQSASKQLSGDVSRTLSAMSKYEPELSTSKTSLTKNRTRSAASKPVLYNPLDFSPIACGHEEEVVRKGRSVLLQQQHWVTSPVDKQQGLSSYSLHNGNDARQQRQSLKMSPEESQHKFHVKSESSSLGLKRGLRVRGGRAPSHQNTRIQHNSVEQGHGEANTLPSTHTGEVAEIPISDLLESLEKQLGTFSLANRNHFSCHDGQGQDLRNFTSSTSVPTAISGKPDCSSLAWGEGICALGSSKVNHTNK
ncbi:uncharacterized protein [Heptranchias perlo]|uniref:uncharacterized protein n=1 Tax=Heptranchias perlo TaxID=212740 RepID=UPI00355AAB21